MNGKDLVNEIARLGAARDKALVDALGTSGFPDVYLEHDTRVRYVRRRIERFRLEAHVRFRGTQMSIADAEDLLHAYGTLNKMGGSCDVEGLRGVIDRGYLLPADTW